MDANLLLRFLETEDTYIILNNTGIHLMRSQRRIDTIYDARLDQMANNTFIVVTPKNNAFIIAHSGCLKDVICGRNEILHFFNNLDNVTGGIQPRSFNNRVTRVLRSPHIT